MKISPRLKNHREMENESSASRSRLRTDSGRRRSASPSRNTTQSAIQTTGRLIERPPNAEFEPRAIFHAT